MKYEKCWCSESDINRSTFFRTRLLHRNSPKVKIGRCSKCGTFRMYENTYISPPDYQGSYEYEVIGGRHFKTISNVDKFHSSGNILDVGCNTGILLSEIKKSINSFSSYKGIDLDKKAIKLGKERYNLDLEAKNLNELKEKYANIVLCHTLEHIENLKDFFAEMDEKLNIEGKIFISVPNVKSLNARSSLRFWKALSPEFHIWYFDLKTLSDCIQFFLPKYKIIHSSSYFIWPPFYYTKLGWNFMEKNIPSIINKMESLMLGDQLDLVLEKSK